MGSKKTWSEKTVATKNAISYPNSSSNGPSEPSLKTRHHAPVCHKTSIICPGKYDDQKYKSFCFSPSRFTYIKALVVFRPNVKVYKRNLIQNL